jgi:hypothetical protein
MSSRPQGGRSVTACRVLVVSYCHTSQPGSGGPAGSRDLYGFRARIGEVLLDPAAGTRGLYDGQAIEADLAADAWRDPAGIWRALNAELWLRELVEAPLPEPVGAAA